MTRQQVNQINQQSKGKTPLVSGVLQRAAVRVAADKEREATQEVESGRLSQSRFVHDFSQVPIGRGGLPIIQAKLMIGAAGDKYEQEADRVAKDVVSRMNAPVSATVQREEISEVDEVELQKKPIVQRKPIQTHNNWNDPELGIFFKIELLNEHGNRRRFRIKDTQVEFEYDESLNQYYDSEGFWADSEEITNQIHPLATGLSALAEFRQKGNTPAKIDAEGERLWHKYYQLQNQGITGGDEVYERLAKGTPWQLTNLGKSLGMNEFEEKALYAYSQPNKDVQPQPQNNQLNPVYMFAHEHWGKYIDGWTALSHALGKIPNLGQLGLSSVPTFRVEKPGSKLMNYLEYVRKPTYIYHGFQTNKPTAYHYWPDKNQPISEVPIGTQQHYASASIMPSSHSWEEDAYKQGVIKFECPSAKYINAWGGMGLLDGGEVLIPPGIITYYDGRPRKEAWMSTIVTFYVLKEVAGHIDHTLPIIDDFKAEPLDLASPETSLKASKASDPNKLKTD